MISTEIGNTIQSTEEIIYEASEETKRHPRVLFLGFCFGIIIAFVFFKTFNGFIKKSERDILDYVQNKPYLLYNIDQFEVHKDSEYKSVITGKGVVDIILTSGSDIHSSFQKKGFDSQEIKIIINLLREAIDFRTLKAGQKMYIEYDSESTIIPKTQDDNIMPPVYEQMENKSIRLLRFKDINGNKILIQRSNNMEYNINVEKPTIKTELRVIQGTITTNLFTDVLSYNVKYNSLYTMLNEYAFNIDFQRDIKKGDKFVMVLRSTMDGDGEIRNEDVLYSNLILAGKKNEIFAFEKEFFNRKGESIKKGLLRSPVDGARISSGFSRARMHPILGYSRAHLGVDFAVPYGTPIYAAGDGVVTYVGWKSGLGNTVTIKHNSTFTTNYGHASKFANVKVGQTVRQRQVIAYVGTTGLATGPHLHFEVLQNGVHINPRNVKMTSIKKLDQSKMIKFAEYVDKVDVALRNSKG